MFWDWKYEGRWGKWKDHGHEMRKKEIDLTWCVAFTLVGLGNGKGAIRNLLGNSLGRITQHVNFIWDVFN